MMRKFCRLMLLPLLLCSLLGCSRKEVPMSPPETETTGGRLMCTAESMEQAQQIAQQYGIELLKFRHGVAVFSTEEDPRAVIERGLEQGWPELSLDRQITIS